MNDDNVTAPADRKRSAEPHAVTAPLRRIQVGDLLADGREVVLVHRSAEYRLRLTSNDKLILTK